MAPQADFEVLAPFMGATVRLEIPGRGAFVPRCESVVPFRDRGLDCYEIKSFPADRAEIPAVGTRGVLGVRMPDPWGDGRGPVVLEAGRTFEVVSCLPGGGVKDALYLLITLAAVPEGE